jgi:hypothetical protein
MYPGRIFRLMPSGYKPIVTQLRRIQPYRIILLKGAGRECNEDSQDMVLSGQVFSRFLASACLRQNVTKRPNRKQKGTRAPQKSCQGAREHEAKEHDLPQVRQGRA